MIANRLMASSARCSHAITLGGCRRPSKFLRPKQTMYVSKRSRYTFSAPDPSMGILYGIIGTNIVIYGAWCVADRDRNLMRIMYRNFTCCPWEVVNRMRFHQLFTAMFSHQSGFHLLFNMYTLYFFGQEALMILGMNQFLMLYIGGGLISSICQCIWPYVTPRSWPARYHIHSENRFLGASGGVSAMVAYGIMMNPTRTILINFILPLPAFVCGLGYMAYDLSGLYYGSGNIGNAAHLGGAAFGAAFYLLRRSRFRRF
jgi:membrane associated rhomboid family serine protease